MKKAFATVTILAAIVLSFGVANEIGVKKVEAWHECDAHDICE